MVAVFTGLGAGFERGSGAALGGAGILGGGSTGRAGESVSINVATGNLLITNQDEFLVGRGPDIGISRTYNSFGAIDYNGDNWRYSTDRRVFGQTGTVNQPHSTVRRVAADGSITTYVWTGSVYEATDGAGAHDTLTYSGGGIGLGKTASPGSRKSILPIMAPIICARVQTGTGTRFFTRIKTARLITSKPRMAVGRAIPGLVIT